MTATHPRRRRITAGVEVAKVFPLLDFATVQGTASTARGERAANHQAQLFLTASRSDPARFSLDRAIDLYRAQALPPRKLVVGVPYFGRADRVSLAPTAASTNAPPVPPAARSRPGSRTTEVLARGGVHYRDSAHGAHWLYDGAVVEHDDRIVVARKMRYVLANRLGGAMMWSLDGDDARGTLTATIDRLLP